MHLHALQHPHNYARPLYLNHKLVLYPISGVPLPLQGLIAILNPLAPWKQRLSLPPPNPFPKPAPSFAIIPVILLVFYAHKVKGFLNFFSFSPPSSLPHSYQKHVGWHPHLSLPSTTSVPAAGPWRRIWRWKGGEMTGAAPPPAS